MRLVSVGLGLVSLFFVFYTLRLLVVTQGLQHTRPGGQGAYIGAVVLRADRDWLRLGECRVLAAREPACCSDEQRSNVALQPTSARLRRHCG